MTLSPLSLELPVRREWRQTKTEDKDEWACGGRTLAKEP